MSTTVRVTVNKGDANSLHQYAASLKKAADDLRFQLQLANQPVRTYLGKQEGDWKNQFKDTWNKISPDFEAMYCPISPSLGEQVYDQLAGTSQWLESYAHDIDVDMANAQKAGVTALVFVGGVVVLGAVSLATAGWGTVPTAVALVGAGTGYGFFSFAAVNYADQVIDNSVVKHDPSPWTDIDFSKVIAEGIKGGVVGFVTTAVALPLASLLRVLGPVLSTGIAFSAGSTLGDVTGQLVVDHQVNPIEVGAAAVTGFALGSLGGAVGAARTVPSAEIGETPGVQATPTLVRGQTELPGGQGVDAQPIVVNGPRGYQVGVQATFKTPLELPMDGQMVRFPAGTQVVFVPGESPTSGTGWFTVPGAGGTTTSFGFQTGGPGGTGLTFLGSTSAPPGSGTSQPTWTPSDGPTGSLSQGPSGGRPVELAPNGTVTAQGRPYMVTDLKTAAATVYGMNDGPVTITPIEKTPPTIGGSQVTISEIPTTGTIPAGNGSAALQPLRMVPPNGVSAVDAVVPPTTGMAPTTLRVVPGLPSEPSPLATPPSSAQSLLATPVVQTPARATAPPNSVVLVPSTVSPSDAPALSQPVQRPVVVPAATLPGVVMADQQVPPRQQVSLPGAQVVSPGPLQAEFVAPTATGAQTIYALAFGQGHEVTAVILDSPTGTAKQVPVQVLSQPTTAYRILDGPGVMVTASDLAMSPDVIAVKFTVATDGTVTVLEHWTGPGQEAPSQVPGPVTSLPGPQIWLTAPETWLTVPAGPEVPAPVPLSVPLPWGPPSGTPPLPTAPPAPQPPSEVPPPVTTLPPLPPVEVTSKMPVELPGLSTQSMVAQPQTWVETRFPAEFQPWPSSQTVLPPQPPSVFTWDAPDADPSRITGRGPDGETLFSGTLNQDGTITMDGGGVGTFVKDPDATSFDDGLGLAVQPDDGSESPPPAGAATVVDADAEAGTGGYVNNLNGGSIQIGGQTIPIGGTPPEAAGGQPQQPWPAAENGASDVVTSLPSRTPAPSSPPPEPQPSWPPQLVWGVPQFFAHIGGQQTQPPRRRHRRGPRRNPVVGTVGTWPGALPTQPNGGHLQAPQPAETPTVVDEAGRPLGLGPLLAGPGAGAQSGPRQRSGIAGGFTPEPWTPGSGPSGLLVQLSSGQSLLLPEPGAVYDPQAFWQQLRQLPDSMLNALLAGVPLEGLAAAQLIYELHANAWQELAAQMSAGSSNFQRRFLEYIVKGQPFQSDMNPVRWPRWARRLWNSNRWEIDTSLGREDAAFGFWKLLGLPDPIAGFLAHWADIHLNAQPQNFFPVTPGVIQQVFGVPPDQAGPGLLINGPVFNIAVEWRQGVNIPQPYLAFPVPLTDWLNSLLAALEALGRLPHFQLPHLALRLRIALQPAALSFFAVSYSINNGYLALVATRRGPRILTTPRRPGEKRFVPFRIGNTLVARVLLALEVVLDPATGFALGVGVFLQVAWNWVWHLVKGVILDQKATLADWFALLKVAFSITATTGTTEIKDISSWSGTQGTFGTILWMAREVTPFLALPARVIRALKIATATGLVRGAEERRPAPAGLRAGLMGLHGRDFEDYSDRVLNRLHRVRGTVARASDLSTRAQRRGVRGWMARWRLGRLAGRWRRQMSGLGKLVLRLQANHSHVWLETPWSLPQLPVTLPGDDAHLAQADADIGGAREQLMAWQRATMNLAIAEKTVAQLEKLAGRARPDGRWAEQVRILNEVMTNIQEAFGEIGLPVPFAALTLPDPLPADAGGRRRLRDELQAFREQLLRNARQVLLDTLAEARAIPDDADAGTLTRVIGELDSAIDIVQPQREWRQLVETARQVLENLRTRLHDQQQPPPP